MPPIAASVGLDRDPIDVLVHAVAYGPPGLFTGLPSDVDFEDFSQAIWRKVNLEMIVEEVFFFCECAGRRFFF